MGAEGPRRIQLLEKLGAESRFVVSWVARLSAAASRSSLSSASSHTRDHHASASPVRIAAVKNCPHVWHSHHTLVPRCGCCATAFSTRQPTCARPVSDRHAQPDWIGGGSESRQMMHDMHSCGTLPAAVRQPKPFSKPFVFVRVRVQAVLRLCPWCAGYGVRTPPSFSVRILCDNAWGRARASGDAHRHRCFGAMAARESPRFNAHGAV